MAGSISAVAFTWYRILDALEPATISIVQHLGYVGLMLRSAQQAHPTHRTRGISPETEKFHPSKKAKTTAKKFWSGLEFLELL
jgi:hypothetical protein